MIGNDVCNNIWNHKSTQRNAIKQNAAKFVNKLTLIDELKFIGIFGDVWKDFVSIYGSLDLHLTDEIAQM